MWYGFGIYALYVNIKSEKVGSVSFWQGQWVLLVLLASSKHYPNSNPTIASGTLG